MNDIFDLMPNMNSEKIACIEKLRQSAPVDISGNEYVGKYILDRNSAQKWIMDNLRDTYVVRDTNEKIKIVRLGMKKVMSHDANNEAHLKSVAVIPLLIENAIFIDERKNEKYNEKFDLYKYYVVGLKMAGVDYTVKIVIGLKNGLQYYDHTLTQLAKEKLIDVANQPVFNDFIPKVAPSETMLSYVKCKDTRLISILQVKKC
jgi:hypothetical protein